MFLDRQGPYRARHLVWPGARYQSGTAAGTHFAWRLSRGTYRRKVFLPWRLLATTPRINRRPNAGGGISCVEGDSGPPRDASEPSWARPCEASGALLLSNGGTGGGHAACTLWPPKVGFRLTKAKSLCDLRIRLWRIRSLWRPLGTFPRGESTSSARRRTKPPTRNTFLVEGKGKSLSCFPRIPKDFASAEATKGLSDRPLETFGPLAADGNFHKK